MRVMKLDVQKALKSKNLICHVLVASDSQISKKKLGEQEVKCFPSAEVLKEKFGPKMTIGDFSYAAMGYVKEVLYEHVARGKDVEEVRKKATQILLKNKDYLSLLSCEFEYLAVKHDDDMALIMPAISEFVKRVFPKLFDVHPKETVLVDKNPSGPKPGPKTVAVEPLIEKQEIKAVAASSSVKASKVSKPKPEMKRIAAAAPLMPDFVKN